MHDNDLKKLQDLTAPPASKRAKAAAIRAAREAFIDDDVQNKAQNKAQIDAKSNTNENKSTSPQGIRHAARLIYSNLKQLWSNTMKKMILSGSAIAAVLAVAIVVPNYLDHQGEKTSPFFLGSVVEKNSSNTPSQKQTDTSADQAAPATEMVDNKPENKAPEYAKAKPSNNNSIDSQANNSLSDSQADTTEVHVISLGIRTAFGGSDSQATSQAPMQPSADLSRQRVAVSDGDNFERVTANPVQKTTEQPVSTFSIDVDTAAYAFIRRQLNHNQLPSKDAVRIEEMINYFDYQYDLPSDSDNAFKPNVTVFPTPWNANTKLMHIGIQGHDVVNAEKPRSNLVFLIDTSGSMAANDKLPLLKQSFRLLLDELHADDTVSIVVYAGSAGTVLAPTKASNKTQIIAALENLQAGGSTAGAAGIELAYQLAKENYLATGTNRIILATDGDFNVGINHTEDLKTYIEKQRDSGVYLSILGFGQGNYNDHLMQTLAQHGNGTAAYIDTLNEARKVLAQEAAANLFPIANDVKIQIEFNPNKVSEYRLIGYETRQLNREDFNNDKIDAGDIGSGHTVTAIYEITPTGSAGQLVDELRYQPNSTGKPTETTEATKTNESAKKPHDSEYAWLKLRYKQPGTTTSRLIETPITDDMAQPSIADVSDDIRFATSVAAFGQLLRGDAYLGDYTFDQIIEMAVNARGFDEFGYRSEFVQLVRQAKSLHTTK
ncbi:vWA domain-containing protein [Ostreibacterium oceani]|uniref:DUF3520 domain-containing protein n=1 Tax=Ostreibacterium oceani TaxID=2654998 RepID=A0A6N7EUQ6_9GAMM|nr:VWA domain-containing protein [Ostreibacterium oceani]MPV86291.1 DUF3520 domain-containing protein [Ostreibacterium oceani]